MTEVQEENLKCNKGFIAYPPAFMHTKSVPLNPPPPSDPEIMSTSRMVISRQYRTRMDWTGQNKQNRTDYKAITQKK